MMPEGRITIDGGFEYEYFIKDHLGNTRAIVNQAGELIESDNYYPFGMQIQALSFTNTNPQNKYLYNGKELQDDFGLDWYQYGARMYDAVIGRFWTIDLLTEKYHFLNIKVTTTPNSTSAWILKLRIRGTRKLNKPRISYRIIKTSPKWIKN